MVSTKTKKLKIIGKQGIYFFLLTFIFHYFNILWIFEKKLNCYYLYKKTSLKYFSYIHVIIRYCSSPVKCWLQPSHPIHWKKNHNFVIKRWITTHFEHYVRWFFSKCLCACYYLTLYIVLLKHFMTWIREANLCLEVRIYIYIHL